MHDHRTGPDPSDDGWPKPLDDHASAFADSVERWLAGGDAPAPDLEALAEEAIREASTILFHALEMALAIPGLPEQDVVYLVLLYKGAALRAGLPADEDLVARRWTAAQQERMQWFNEHGDIARQEGGIMLWDAIPNHIRWVLYDARVLTVKQVTELARQGRLTDLEGIGPARAKVIMTALGA